MQIKNELALQLKQKRSDFEQMRSDNRSKDEEICAAMRKQVRKRNELEMEKASIENKDKMREA